MHWILPLFLFIALIGDSHACSTDSCNAWSTEKDVINVHIVPHSHQDAGWIETVDEYFWNSRQRLVNVGVQYIYNTVIDELQKDPSRRFTFAETGFLWRWVQSNPDFERHKLQKLVKTGQVEIVNGGWVQDDEAASFYPEIIDQMTLGLRKISMLYGECKPTVAWQIDPFGHSKEVASLFAQMGYEALYFARIHYLEKERRLANKSLEFIWNTSDDLKTQILTGAFYQDNYGPPDGFCFDTFCSDTPIMDNKKLDGYNVNEKVDAFIKHVRKQASFQRTNHVLILMGSDFQYSNANMWFHNLDKLIRYVTQKDSKIKMFYSTPGCYTKAVIAAQPQLPTKSDDFFPYASGNESYWTGYFTSRPALKAIVRKASSWLQLIKQLDALAFLGVYDESDVEVLEQASALTQHHDAVTGTAKENVTRDYVKRLTIGINEASAIINDAFANLLPRNAGDAVPPQFICQFSNETVCEATKKFNSFTLTVFNSRAQKATSIVRVPYYSQAVTVIDANGQKVAAQLTKTAQMPVGFSQGARAPFELWIPATIGPLGFTTFFITNSSKLKNNVPITHPIRNANRDLASDVAIENDLIRVDFDDSGHVKTIFDKTSNISYPLTQQFLYYEGAGNVSQPSGAYIFRPNKTEPVAFGGPIKLDLVKSKDGLVQEVRQTVTSWIYQTIRLYANRSFVEFEWTVGPLPKEKENPIGKEVVTRYRTGIKSGDVFFTDANGRQIVQRKRNYSESFKWNATEPTAGNYYPISNRIYIKDDQSQLTVLTDRSEGGTAKDGTVELMLHRRLFWDDHFGVDEALDEPGYDGKGLIARGSHYILIGKQELAARAHRPLALEIFHSPKFSVAELKTSPGDFIKHFKTSYAGLTQPLPEHLHLLTLQQWEKKSLLLRLEHIYQNNEDPEVSRPVQIDLKNLFSGFSIDSVNELTLAANRNATNAFTWPPHVKNRTWRGEINVELKPMEIKTFQLEVTPH